MTEAPAIRKHGKNAFLFVIVCVAMDMIGFGIIIPVMPSLLEELTGNPAEETIVIGGYLMATYGLLNFAAMPTIGNLSDLTPRAVEILSTATLIAAEDTRTLNVLLTHIAASTPSISLTEHNVESRIPHILDAARTGAVALTSDAGTPVVADPGARLVDAAHDAAIPVYAVAGPSALAAAVSVSGFVGSDVHFLGFLPRTSGERRRRLVEAATTAATLVYFESPRRLAASLRDVAEALDDPPVAVCRELTKLHEETVRGTASTLAERFGDTLGECTVVVDVRHWADSRDERALREYLSEMKEAGARRSPAAAAAARRFNVPRSDAYDAWPADDESS